MTGVCAACGAQFTASRVHARTCSGRCRKRLQRQRALPPDELQWQRLEARRAFRRGAIDGWEALDVLTMPPAELLAMLRGRVAA
jgi:hypothetical protein